MDLVVETTSEKQLSAYEIERKKHTPTLIHGAIQANLIVLIAVKYPNLFRIASEVALATQPDGSTPDLVLYPFSELDYKNDPARRTDAPLLVVEIQSPSQSSKEMTEKLEPYFYFGIKSCWIVVPDFQGVFVYSNAFTYEFFHHDEILTDTTLNIEIDLKDIFK